MDGRRYDRCFYSISVLHNPVIAFVADIGGAASTFSWVEPFRPYLIGLTVLLLGFVWYQKLKPQWDPECACEENPSFWNTKEFLGAYWLFCYWLSPTTRMPFSQGRITKRSCTCRKARCKPSPGTLKG
jgi:hypothetical protein